MSTRFLTRSLLYGTLALTGAAAPCWAQGWQTDTATRVGGAPTETALVERLYPVADLIVPVVETTKVDIRNFVKLSECGNLAKGASGNANSNASDNQPPASIGKAVEASAPAKTSEDELIAMLTTCVEPTSWAGKGGKATIAYHSGCMTLAVHAIPAHQERIAAVLAELRRLQETQVSLEVRMITISEAMAERVGLNSDSPGAITLPTVPRGASEALVKDAASHLPRVTLLNSSQVADLQATIQGDQHTSIAQLPKVTLFNGQKTRLSAGDTQSFVTSVDQQKIDGQAVFVPRSEVLPTSGFYLSAKPTVSADRRYVKLELQTNFTKLATPNIQLFPITSFITPVFEGGAVGQPVPFTQFLQQPVLMSLLVDCSLNLPDGDTALLTGYRQMAEVKHQSGLPGLSKIPYLARLFTNVGYARENVPSQVALLVTPRIIADSDAEMRSVLAHQVSKLRGANPLLALNQNRWPNCSTSTGKPAPKAA